MATTLVTGASGLVGSHVAAALVARGDRVRVVVPARAAARALGDLDVEVVAGSVTDRTVVRKALRDVDRLFHVPDATTLRAGWKDLYRANVAGTRVVLEEALEAGVARVVHTSAAAAIGPAGRGAGTVDETHVYNAARTGLSYANAKAEAEREALRICAQGLPVVIVNPAHVLGRGDTHRGSTELVRRFLRREIPFYVDGALCVVGAEDVARGHLLAEEHGVVGERYILGGRNFTNDRLFADLYTVMWFFERAEVALNRRLVDRDALMATLGFHCWWWGQVLLELRGPKAVAAVHQLADDAGRWARSQGVMADWEARCTTDFAGGGPKPFDAAITSL